MNISIVHSNRAFLKSEINPIGYEKKQCETQSDTDYLDTIIKVASVFFASILAIALVAAKPEIALLGLVIIAFTTIAIFYNSQRISFFFRRVPSFIFLFDFGQTQRIINKPTSQPSSSRGTGGGQSHESRSGRGGNPLDSSYGFGQNTSTNIPTPNSSSGRGFNSSPEQGGNENSGSSSRNPLDCNPGFGQRSPISTPPPQQQSRGNPLSTNYGFSQRTSNDIPAPHSTIGRGSIPQQQTSVSTSNSSQRTSTSTPPPQQQGSGNPRSSKNPLDTNYGSGTRKTT